MKLQKKVLAFAAVSLSIVALITLALVLVSDDTLKNAARNCDTISIVAEYDATEHSLSAVQTVEYKNRSSEPINEVKFHIYANAYKDGAKNPPVDNTEVPQAYPNGKNFGGITIHDVSSDKKALDTQIDGDDDTVLVVPLDKPLEKDKTAQIDISYTVKLANIKHRLGWTDDAVNLANFYPVPCVLEDGVWKTYPYSASGDPFYNGLHNFDVKLTAPKDYVMASSGAIIKSSDKGGKVTTTLKSSAIRDFAAVLSTKFKSLTKNVGKTQVKYFYIDDDAPESSLTTSVKALKTFNTIFTKYPYRQLSVVQTDFLHGGMEYGELVYISRDVLVCDECDKDDTCAHEIAHADHDRVIVHEIAHQWWYGLVGNNQSSNAWIDEGLAEYSTLLFYDHNPEYNVDRKIVIENARANYTAYLKLVHGVGAEFDSNMNRELNDFNSAYEYTFLTYVRGMLLFCDLESILTKTSLTQALSNYAHATKFGIATQASLVESIEKSSGAKVGVFFDTYLIGVPSA